MQIAECEMIRDLATDHKKRELFDRLARHHKVLAGELEKAIIAAQTQPVEAFFGLLLFVLFFLP